MNNTPVPSAQSGAVSAVVLACPGRRTELRERCGEFGYAVTVAPDAYAAAVKLLTGNCDVLLVDLGSSLPGGRRVMAMAAEYHIPVVDVGETGETLADLSRWGRSPVGAGRSAAVCRPSCRDEQPVGEDAPHAGDVLTSKELAALLERDA